MDASHKCQIAPWVAPGEYYSAGILEIETTDDGWWWLYGESADATTWVEDAMGSDAEVLAAVLGAVVGRPVEEGTPRESSTRFAGEAR